MARHHHTGAHPGLLLGLCTLCIAGIVQAGAAPASNPGDAPNGQPVTEVTVTGKMDARTLDHAINQFVQSHAKPSTLIGQVGRWNMKVCVAVDGLQGSAAEFVSHQIQSVARSVGAPTPSSEKKCATNVEVVFTGEPQGLLDHIATAYPMMLGYYRDSDRKRVTTFSHPVQAWYMTGTRSLDAGLPFGGGPCNGCDPTGIVTTGLRLDSAYSDGSLGLGASGTLEKHFTRGYRSEFVHILVIVDSKAVAKHSLRSISDYIALLTLTRIESPNSCNGLSSILTLFDTECGQPPAAMTSADSAYLKALYSADLDMNLNVEQSDLHRRMLQVISSK
jgi:hypothetical protein